ncbi:MAG: AtzE family amidohydrolase [Okeania sp. SIO3B5]|uniref:AtzE family amidohydrolase n=1 Tax=Okeania sp. SIO3B5 TaxID=2607811 RepID=UPI0013FE64CB|nr:AtzE family amidohydrolase [Okeania sp. SIO3B5]NEO57216.1 AtzE family amidohydrolase [Okeania sp. SIO3B5]
MTIKFNQIDATAIATAIKTGETTAQTIVDQCLQQINQHNQTLNCFTTITTETALNTAKQIDTEIAQGKNPGILAGVPFAVKNLYDIAGITTLAGAKINAENPPATEDATAVAKLKQAGAILIGALNMDEYAYGFVTENSHYGATPNPHDLTRISGGSSGGSAAAVAAGLVPITLGSDTNGSIRVPASLCGVFGFKPTYGRLSRAGVFLFASSLDHVGPFARSVRDIATVYDVLQGSDIRDPVCTHRTPEACLPQLDRHIEGLRIAVADSHFATGGESEVFAAVEQVATVLGVTRRVTIPEAHRARAAAYIITAAEGANLHLENLRTRPQDFDPATRDRFLAGALIPADWYIQAQRFRRWYQSCVGEIFKEVDIILAPTTPCVAPLLGQEKMTIAGEEILVRPNLGLYTQPLSFIGLPVLSVPIRRTNGLPLGVQIIAAPYNEALILRVAAALEMEGIIAR